MPKKLSLSKALKVIDDRRQPKLRAADPQVQTAVSRLFLKFRAVAEEAEILAAKLEASRDRDQLQAGAEAVRVGMRCLGHFTPAHVMRGRP